MCFIQDTLANVLRSFYRLAFRVSSFSKAKLSRIIVLEKNIALSTWIPSIIRSIMASRRGSKFTDIHSVGD